MSVVFYQPGEKEDSLLTHAIIAARYQDRWIFVRRPDEKTWNMPNIKRLEGETIDQTAQRALYTTTGATQTELHPVCSFSAQAGEEEGYGMLYFAIITEKGDLPADSGIAEYDLRHPLPRKMNFKEIQQPLYHQVQDWLNRQTSADEMWDVYAADGTPTGRLHRRGDPLVPGEFHLAVDVWVVDSKNRTLLTLRSTNKGNPLLWEITGGSAQAGDDSLTAALREVWEETGIELDPDNGTLVLCNREPNCFRHVWVFRQDVDLDAIQLLEGETCDAILVTRDQLLRLRADDMFVPCKYLVKLFDHLDSHK